MSDPGAPPPQPPASEPPPFNPYAQPNIPVYQPVAPPSPEAKGTRSLVVIVVAGALLLAGGAFLLLRPDDPPSPGEALQAWVQAGYEEDAGAVCDGLARSNLLEIEEEDGTTCEEGFEALFASADPELISDGDGASSDPLTPLAQGGGGQKPEVVILAVEIDGDRAEVRARIDGEDASEGPVVLVKEDGRWKLDFSDPAYEEGPDTSCEVEERTVETAVEAHRAMTDEYPDDAQDLVDSGMLRAVPEHAEVGPGGTVRMTGDCA